MHKRKEPLLCKDVEKMIQSYIADEMDVDTLEQFMEHVEHCDSCREELAIQFLVSTGLKNLEVGNNFDLNKELLDSLDCSKRMIQKKHMIRRILLGMILIGIVALLVLIAYIWLR